MCKCANGSISCNIMVVDPTRKMKSDGQKVVIESDTSIENIKTFGMCNNLCNPSVAEATAAAQGVLTPMPCKPSLVGRWQRNVKKISVNGKKVVSKKSTLKCAFGGCISIVSANAHKTKSE